MKTHLTLTYKSLLDMKEPLRKLFALDIDIRLALRLKKLMDEIEKNLNDFDECRLKLIRKYGETVEGNGGPFEKVKAENMLKFNDEIVLLLDETVEIEFEKIKLSDLEGIKFSAIDLKLLEPFFVFD